MKRLYIHITRRSKRENAPSTSPLPLPSRTNYRPQATKAQPYQHPLPKKNRYYPFIHRSFPTSQPSRASKDDHFPCNTRRPPQCPSILLSRPSRVLNLSCFHTICIPFEQRRSRPRVLSKFLTLAGEGAHGTLR